MSIEINAFLMHPDGISIWAKSEADRIALLAALRPYGTPLHMLEDRSYVVRLYTDTPHDLADAKDYVEGLQFAPETPQGESHVSEDLNRYKNALSALYAAGNRYLQVGLIAWGDDPARDLFQEALAAAYALLGIEGSEDQ